MDNEIWQMRVMHGMRYSRHKKAFHYSQKIGLDFNVTSKTKQKLDLQLLTNGLVLEVCDFARLVNRGKRHFVADILENNFNLGLENEQQRNEFAHRILPKINALTRKPQKDKRELFILPGCNYALTLPCEHVSNPRSSDICKNDWSMASTEHIKAECLSMEVDGLHAGEIEHADEDKSPKMASTEESKGDPFPHFYPLCGEIGLNLGSGSKQSLNVDVLTKGVMLEVVHFTKIVCGAYSPIVLDVLEHNFELDLKSQKAKSLALVKIANVNKRKKQIINVKEIKTLFKREVFSFQINPLKRSREATSSNNQKIEGPAPKYQFKEVTKRRQSDLKSKQKNMALLKAKESVFQEHRRTEPEHVKKNIIFNGTDLYTCQMAKCDQGLRDVHSYTCPLGESDLDSDDVTDSENTGNQESIQKKICCSPSPNRSLGVHEETFLTPIDCSSICSSVSPDLIQPFASYSNAKGISVSQGQTQTPMNSKVLHDYYTMEQSEMGTDKKMWKLRANRANKILSMPAKEYCAFSRCKKIGLDFNVGSGVKQNLNVKLLTNTVLFEVAKFTVAMNSSQQDFIMEILEYNFDIGLKSEQHRHTFASETMHRVRQLTNCEDVLKFSKEVFELPDPMLNKLSTNTANQYSCSVSVNPEISSISQMEVNDIALMSPPDSHAETKAIVTEKSVDLYPHCKEMGLNLHVNKGQANEKLDFNILTKGTMIEVANFANVLCGTFEQIFLDVLGHNFDLDLQRGKSDLARYILAQIPAIMEQRNLAGRAKYYRDYNCPKNRPVLMTQWVNSLSTHTCSTVNSQTPITGQNVGSSIEIQQKRKEQDKMSWILRANRSQQILSVPHVEDCPFYCYSRCKKLGIDFNVGSGVKQNLDPKLLTNGIMVEVNTFARAMLAAQKDFITEILEYNFELGLKNELYRYAFAQETLKRFRRINPNGKCPGPRMNMAFELPDPKCIEESNYAKAAYCPKCYQDRNRKLCGKDESDPDLMHHPHPHAKMDTVFTDAHCTAQEPIRDLSSTLRTTEGARMSCYPQCKKIGLRLCVDQDKSREKLGLHLLTLGVMKEVACFAKKLCGSKREIINDVLEHNFNLGMQSRETDLVQRFNGIIKQMNGGLAWFNEVFLIKPCRQKDPGDCYPLCKEIGLDLNVKSKSGVKAKLDLKLLTWAVMFEIHKYSLKKVRGYLPSNLYDILDYNFDLSSQNHRRWEFSLCIAHKVKNMVKIYRKNLKKAEEVFELPFVFCSKASKKSARDERKQKKNAKFSLEEPDKESVKEGRFVQVMRYHSDDNHIYFLDGAKPLAKNEEEPGFHYGNTECKGDINYISFIYQDPGITQMNGSTVSVDCDTLQENGSFNIHIKEEKYDPHYGDVTTESNTEDLNYLVPGATPGSPGYAVRTICQDTESKLTSDETNRVQENRPADLYMNTGGSDLHHGDVSHIKNEVDIKQEKDL